MKKYRYIGIRHNGHVIRGVKSAPNKKSLRESLRILEIKQSFRLKKVIPEQTFIYKARNGTEKPVTGEQKAFEKSDVETALRKMGYSVMYVRKKFLSMRLRPSSKDIVVFIRICADLLRENLPYDEILHMLSTDMGNKALKRTLRTISKDLKDGKEGKEVFGKHERIFGKFPAYMLGVASTSGDMAAVYDSTARFMERNEEFKKTLRQSLVMPAVVLFFMGVAVIFYVAYIFPKTVELFTKFDLEIPPMTAATMAASTFLKDYFMIIAGVIIAVVCAGVQFVRSTKGRYILDAVIIKLPYAGGAPAQNKHRDFFTCFSCVVQRIGR